MSDQVIVAIVSALGSALVAWITAHENRKKSELKEKEMNEIERLKKENAQLKGELEKKGEKKSE